MAGPDRLRNMDESDCPAAVHRDIRVQVQPGQLQQCVVDDILTTVCWRRAQRILLHHCLHSHAAGDVVEDGIVALLLV